MVRQIFWISLFLPLLVWAQDDPRLRGEHYNINDFSGGYVTNYDLIDTDPKFCFFVDNLEIDEGRMRLRKGYKEHFAFTTDITGPAYFDSAFSAHGYITDVFCYNISGPSFDSLSVMKSATYTNTGEVFVVAGFDTVAAADTVLVPIFHMYPTYSSNNELLKGSWSDGWSKDYNMPNRADYDTLMDYMNCPGRDTRLVWSKPLDFSVENGVLRAATGSKVYLTSSIYTYPFWFGYIGRYRWNGSNLLDNFYLYQSTLAELDTGVVISDSIKYVATTTPGGDLPDGNDIDDAGRYWIKVAYEYDGYQYSIPKGDSIWYIDIPDVNNMLQISFKLDSLDIDARITAIVIFTSDAIGSADPWHDTGGFEFRDFMNISSAAIYNDQYIVNMGEYGYSVMIGVEGIDWNNLNYYFRKRVVIADIDSNDIGYPWKENHFSGDGGQIEWDTLSGANSNKTITVWIDGDDMGSGQPDMWSFLGHNSTEISVFPEYMNVVQGQMIAGDVLIDGPNSDIKEKYRNMVIFSALGKPDILPANNFVIVGANSGSYVTGIEEWMGNAIIFTNDALEVWSPGAPPQRIAQYRDRGCTAPLSISVTPHGIYYANRHGVNFYDGSGPPKIISNLIDDSFDSVTTNNSITYSFPIDYSVGAYFPNDNQYTLWVSFDACGNVCMIPGVGYALSTGGSGGGGISGWSKGVNWWYSLYWGGGGGAAADTDTVYIGTGGNFCGVYVHDIDLGSWLRWTHNSSYGRFVTGVDGSVYGLIYGSPAADKLMKMKTNTTTGVYLDDGSYYSGTWDSGWTDFGQPGIEKEIKGVLLDYMTKAGVASNSISAYLYSEGNDSPYDTLTFNMLDTLRVCEWENPDLHPDRTNINGQWPLFYKIKIVIPDSALTIINSEKIVIKSRKLRE